MRWRFHKAGAVVNYEARVPLFRRAGIDREFAEWATRRLVANAALAH